MRTRVTFRHQKPSKALKDYATEKASKVTKYLEEPITAHMVLEVQRDRHSAQLTINAHGTICQGEKTTRDMYSAIDGVLDKVEKQLRRHKGKGRRGPELTHHAAIEKVMLRGRPTPPAPGGREGEPRIIRSEQIAGKPMSVEEAALQLERIAHNFLVFRNDESEEINVLYKRKDGAYGLIDPSL